MQGLTAIFTEKTAHALRQIPLAHEMNRMEYNEPLAVDANIVVLKQQRIHMCEALEAVVMAMLPLTAEQATKLVYNDARLIWLYSHAKELDHCIQLATFACNAAKVSVPLCVFICATWLTVCRTTSFLNVERALEREWKFTLKAHETLYIKLNNTFL